MKKKIYDSPRVDIVFIHNDTPLLAGSVMIPGADNEPPGAPELDDYFKDNDEIQKLLFG